MGQSPSSNAEQPNEVNGDGPRKRDDNAANRGRGEAALAASQPLPNPREAAAAAAAALLLMHCC